MKLKPLLLLVFFCLPSFAQSSNCTLNSGTLSCDPPLPDAPYTASFSVTPLLCGPPKYPCSRSDLKVAQTPNPPPAMGAANSIVKDPDFGNRILRATDADLNPLRKNLSYLAGAGSSNANTWNTDSSLLYVVDTNSTGYPLSFSPNTMTVSRMYVANFSNTGGMTIGGQAQWSKMNPNYLYKLQGTRLFRYDFSNRTTPPSPVLVYDFTTGKNCLPAGYSPTWAQFGGVSAGDASFVAGYSNSGFQGTGSDVVVYTPGKGCTHLNTVTGQITSDSGLSGSVTSSDRFTIHDVFSTLNSEWVIVGFTKCLSASCGHYPYFWQLGSLSLTACGASGANLCGGHWTSGYAHWENNDGDPTQAQYHQRNFLNLGQFYPVIQTLSTVKAPMDQHPSWNNVDALDSYPFLSSTWTTASPYSAAWPNEVLAISPVEGWVKRFAHTFNSNKSQRFATEQAIGQVSQDGRFFLFSSDWQGTLGSEQGAAACILGTNCRGDVFIVELQ